MTQVELTNTTENHNKYWKAEILPGRRVRCTWGRIGSVGGEKEFRFDDDLGPRRFLKQKYTEKLRKGYVESAGPSRKADAVATVLGGLIKKVKTQPAEKADGRIFFFYTDDVMADFQNRYDGTHDRLSQVFDQLVPVVLDRIGKTARTWRWSRYAGCSCPCSPGFIVKNLSVDVYVDLASK